jgi:hypothetical protein
MPDRPGVVLSGDTMAMEDRSLVVTGDHAKALLLMMGATCDDFALGDDWFHELARRGTPFMGERGVVELLGQLQEIAKADPAEHVPPIRH